MANSNNVYATAKPLEGNVSDWVQGQERMNLVFRQEERAVQKIAQDRKDKQLADHETWQQGLTMPDFPPTGIRATDEIISKAIFKAQPIFNDLHKESGFGISAEKKAEINAKQRNLNNLPKQIKLGQEAVVNEMKAIQLELKAGTRKSTPEILEKLQRFENGHYDIELDSQMNPMIALWDKNTGKADVISHSEYMAGQTFGKAIPNVNFNEALQKIGVAMKPKTVGTDSGYVSNVKIKPDSEVLSLTARSQLYSDNGSYTDLATSKLYDMGVRDFENVPKEKLDQLQSETEGVLASFMTDSDITKKNYGAANQASEIARRTRKDAADKKPQEPTRVEFKKTSIVKGQGASETNEFIKNIDGASVYSWGGNNMKRASGNKDAYQKVRKVYITKDKNEMIFDVEDVDGVIGKTDGPKGKSTNKIKKAYSSKKDAGEMGDFVSKYKDANGEFYKDVEDFGVGEFGLEKGWSKSSSNRAEPMSKYNESSSKTGTMSKYN